MPLAPPSFLVALWIPAGKLPLSSKGRFASGLLACSVKGAAVEIHPLWIKYEHFLTIR